jgi:DNA modification methylase/sporulation protein YlmC with PRC-barrel domain
MLSGVPSSFDCFALVVKLADLTPDSRNANRGTARGRKFVRESLKRYGAGRSILLDRNGAIIAGNKTAEAAQAMGMEDVQVVQTDGSKLIAVQRTDLDIDSKAARELAIADNRASEVGLEWDVDVLKEFVIEEVDLAPFWGEREISALLGLAQEEAPEPKLDQAEALRQKWDTKRGQIWEIGKHRLMCGDSTSQVDVDRMWRSNAKCGALLATDPPYGVAYGVDSGADSAQRFGSMAGDGADGPKLQAFLESVFMAAIPHLRDDAAWYLWHAQLTQGFFAAAAAQLKVHRQIIWAKNHFILGHGDYHWQHELCFYGWREGHRARWFEGRDQSTLWQIDRPSAATSHPTEKPIEIFTRAMRNNTQAGEVCYEPFCGSGTQLCAAESCDRTCYALEIEPKYVAVALQRLADMGLKPVLAHA